MAVLDILQAIDVSSPMGQQLVRGAVQLFMGPQESPEQLQARLARERIEAERELLRSMPPPQIVAHPPQPIIIHMPAGTQAPTVETAPVQTVDLRTTVTQVPGMDAVVERLTVVSGNLKEALRFAREDGIDHPETQKRLAAAQADMVELERHDLRPEVLTALPPGQRQAVEEALVPLRRARQNLHNAEDGGPVSVDSMTMAAAQVGQVATGLRVARAATAAGITGPAPAVPLAPVTPPATTAEARPYSQYAPDMEIDTGCLPCGRAHLAGVDATLERASVEAQTRGMADPDVQARLQTADEELAMLDAYDWTPERIQRSPAADRAILEEYRPKLLAVRERLQSARTPADLTALAQDMAAIRQGFMAADEARGGNQDG